MRRLLMMELTTSGGRLALERVLVQSLARERDQSERHGRRRRRKRGAAKSGERTSCCRSQVEKCKRNLLALFELWDENYIEQLLQVSLNEPVAVGIVT